MTTTLHLLNEDGEIEQEVESHGDLPDVIVLVESGANNDGFYIREVYMRILGQHRYATVTYEQREI